MFLLDTNTLIALSWPAHDFHQSVQRWFRRHASEGWATCALTQAGFVRIISNPAFSPHAVSPNDALVMLRDNLKHPAHRFWGMDVSLMEAVLPVRDRLVGHQQVTDAYLLGLAIRKNGRLVTLDNGVSSLLPPSAALHRIDVIAV